MLVLLDTSHDLDVCSKELDCDTGQLLTPLSGFRLRDPERPWAIDNGAYAGFDSRAFMARLKRQEYDKRNCLFVVAPDVVGSARRTLEVFEIWKERLSGWPIAFACQDGQENISIPWNDVNSIFIGGTTKWKLSSYAAHCIAAAQILGKWVHVGRVNDPARYTYFEEMGVDSIDGTGLALYSHMREAIARRNNQERLFESDLT